MIRINPNPTFTGTALLTVHGEQESASVSFTFRHKTLADLGKWYRDNTEDESIKASTALMELIADWNGVVDEAGKEVKFSEKSLESLLANYSASFGEIYSAYLSALTESRAKN